MLIAQAYYVIQPKAELLRRVESIADADAREWVSDVIKAKLWTHEQGLDDEDLVAGARAVKHLFLVDVAVELQADPEAIALIGPLSPISEETFDTNWVLLPLAGIDEDARGVEARLNESGHLDEDIAELVDADLSAARHQARVR